MDMARQIIPRWQRNQLLPDVDYKPTYEVSVVRQASGLIPLLNKAFEGGATWFLDPVVHMYVHTSDNRAIDRTGPRSSISDRDKADSKKKVLGFDS